MKPTKDELRQIREQLSHCVVRDEWARTKNQYLPLLDAAIRRYDEYSEKDLHNLILGAGLVMEQV